MSGPNHYARPEDPQPGRHRCPWHKSSVRYVRTDHDGEHVYMCPHAKCGLSHHDPSDDFCWCQK